MVCPPVDPRQAVGGTIGGGGVPKIRGRIQAGVLVADLLGAVPADPPPADVAGEEHGVAPAGDERLDRVALGVRPVLVVTGRDEEIVVVEQRWIAVEILRVAVFRGHPFVVEVLHDPNAEVGEVRLPEEDVARPVQGNEGARHVISGRRRVQALPPPGIVGVPGRARGLDENPRGRAGLVFTDHEHAVAPVGERMAIGQKFRVVDARDPALRHPYAQGDRPTRTVGIRTLRYRARGGRHRCVGGDGHVAPGSQDSDLGRRVGRAHVKTKGVALGHRKRGRVSLDRFRGPCGSGKGREQEKESRH